MNKSHFKSHSIQKWSQTLWQTIEKLNARSLSRSLSLYCNHYFIVLCIALHSRVNWVHFWAKYSETLGLTFKWCITYLVANKNRVFNKLVIQWVIHSVIKFYVIFYNFIKNVFIKKSFSTIVSIVLLVKDYFWVKNLHLFQKV